MALSWRRIFLCLTATLTVSNTLVQQSISGEQQVFDTSIADAPQYVIERLIINGNDTVSSELICSALFLKVGDVFHEEQARLSRLKLLGLGLFSEVTMRLDRGSRRGLIFWIIIVRERGNLLINGAFLGINEQKQPFGGLSWSHRNVRDDGQAVSLDLTLGKAGGRGVRFQWIDPSMTRHRLSLDATCWWSQTRDEFRGEYANMNVRYSRIGGHIGLGYQNRGFSTFQAYLRTESINEQQRSLGDWQGKYLFPKHKSILSSLTVSVEWDQRNDVFLPSDGTRLAFWAQFASSALGSDFDYAKFIGTFEFSHPTQRAQYLHGKLEIGGILGAAPIFEQFYESQAVRGQRYAPFLGVTFEEENPKEVLGAVNVEYHWLYFQKRTGFLYKAETYLFFDFGAVFDSEEVERIPVTTAVGPGLIFDTDIGSIRIALGFFL